MKNNPQQLQFQGSAESIGFKPIQIASAVPAIEENIRRVDASRREVLALERDNLDRVGRLKASMAGRDMEALSKFSGTLSNYLTKVAEQTNKDIEDGAMYDAFMSEMEGLDVKPGSPEAANAEAEDTAINEANRQGDIAARTANQVETETNNPVLGNAVWNQFSGLARGVRGEEALLMRARSGYSGWMQAFLQSNATFSLGGERMTVAQAVASGDPRLTQAAIAAGRFQFMRENGLQNTTKRNFVSLLMPTMYATEGAISGSLVQGAIKEQREARTSELKGQAYALAQETGFGEVGSTFETLSRQFFQGGLGISRAQANQMAVEAMISGFEDAGNVDALQAMLDVQQVPGQAGTELRRRYGNEINDALRRANSIKDDLDGRVVKDIEAGMYEQLAGAQTQQQRDSIIEQAASDLEAAGRFKEARQLRQERDELSVAGANELNASRLEEGLRTGAVTAQQVEEARLRGDITPQQAAQLLRDSGNDDSSKEAKADLKDPLYSGILDSYGDRAENQFLGLAGHTKDVYGRVVLSDGKLVTTGEAEIITQQMRNDLRRVAMQTLAVNAGASEEAKQRALHTALGEWYSEEVEKKGGKYWVPVDVRVEQSGKPPRWDRGVQTRLRGLVRDPASLASGHLPRGLEPKDFSTQVSGTNVPQAVVNNFRRVRGDKLFSKDTLEILRDDFERNGTIQQGLQKAAQRLGMSPLALLQQQSAAYGLDPVQGPAPTLQSSSGNTNGAPLTGVRGAQTLMALGFPAKGAAWLAGNIQQESNWNGNRQPWDDGGAPAGGLVSWRAGRLANAEAAVGDISRATPQAQLRYMVQEMKEKYPDAYRIFMNPRATERQLIQASKAYWSYGEEGARYQYARDIQMSLTGRSTAPGQRPQGVSRFGTPQQRAVNVGRMIVSQGGGVWQNSAFDLDRGYVGSGGRVGQHSSNSYHYSDAALDIPVSHNNEANLRRIFNYLRQHQQLLGIKELFWNPMGFYRNGSSIGGAGSNAIPDHDSHIHVAFG